MPETSPPGDLYTFPDGLPGFEQWRRFRLSRRDGLDPLLFLECPEAGGPSFVCVPVEVLDPGYSLRFDEAAANTLGGAADCRAVALLTFPAGAPPTANLLAPVVLNPARGAGAQVIQFDSDYSVVHPLREATPCS